jgi:hypothetical protein
LKHRCWAHHVPFSGDFVFDFDGMLIYACTLDLIADLQSSKLKYKEQGDDSGSASPTVEIIAV